ncbi:MAG: hypothetical protein GY714_23645, partial [Desulfobacterales bacterium]|nr:hypothetical protein [Desulfobacterales bacterium]
MGEKTSITKPKQPSVNYGSGFNNFTKTRKDTVIASREGWKAGMERRAKYNPRLRGVVNDQKKIDKKYSKSTETALSEMRSGDWDTDSSAAKLSKKEMEVLSVSDRLGLITIIANGFSVVDEDEQTLVRLLATAPASDAKQIISGLGSSNSTLLDRFENIMHGDEYKQYHKILNALYFQSMKPKEAANKMKSAKELPWSDPGFIKSLWTERYYYRHIKITDKGKIQFKYFYVKRTMGKEEQ